MLAINGAPARATAGTGRSRFVIRLLLVLLSAAATGCAPNIAYRTDYRPCVSPQPLEDCKKASLQVYTDPDDSELGYKLGFVEFDDQGQLYDRRQMETLLDYLYKEAGKNNLLISVFVHGWHHNARPGDNNIVNFRKSLLKLSRLEHFDARMKNQKPREVIGVYVGWRGEAWTIPYLNTLTFWNRKSTAQRVGHNGITEFFSRLEVLRNAIQSTQDGDGGRKNRLVVIGHSFGGAVVFSALSQILMDRFVATTGPSGVASDARGFADLVILINPAFEALQFSTLSDMANGRGRYFADQAPVMAVLTSESDWATKYAFWFGRVFSTLPDKHRDVTRVNRASGKEQEVSQWSADTTALGHFKPYITHRLEPSDALENADVNTVLQSVRNGWRNDRPGNTILFPGSKLEHLDKSVSRNPYLNIQVDKHIIPNHNDIYDQRVIDFLAYLIMISTVDTGASAPVASASARAHAAGPDS